MKYELVVPQELRESSRHWTLKCIAAANPQSDEEPEDMIKQCELTGLQLFGVNTRVYRICPTDAVCYTRDADEYDAETAGQAVQQASPEPPENWFGPEALGLGITNAHP